MQNGNWYSSSEAAKLLGISQRGINKNREAGKYITRLVKGNGGEQYEFFLDRSGQHQHTKSKSQPLAVVQESQEAERLSVSTPEIKEEETIESEIYSNAPEWAREKAIKYIKILKETKGLKGLNLKEYINIWNHNHRDLKTSYRSIIEMRKKYESEGVTALLPKYGKTVGKTTVNDQLFEYFKSRYLKQGAPSARSCWIYTLGYAQNNGLEIGSIPSPTAFVRRLENEVPEESIYMARYGKPAWNRKYAPWINRNYDDIKCGQVWVSDHAQIDVMVIDSNGKVCAPWVTVWRDFKSGLWLGWNVHCESPNSDYIFMSFHAAVEAHGLPEEVIIDNGKDYRCKDFAGGRKYIKVTVDENKSTSMLSLLGVTVHFSLPYRAQTKPVERDFNTNKELFSKHMECYRGGNVVERPEILKDEIKANKMMTIADFIKMFDGYVTEGRNKMISSGKNLKGLSPYQLWHKENPVKKVIGKDALKLFCMRTAEPVMIGRNGVYDSKLQVTYWAEWMPGVKGKQVYLRRDIKNYTEAWVFAAANDEFLGKAQLAESAAALAKTEVSKMQLQSITVKHRQEKKIVEQYIKNLMHSSPEELLSNFIAGVSALGGGDVDQVEQKLIQLANTEMDKVVAKEKEMKKEGTNDLPIIQRPERKKLVLFESDK